MVLRCLTVLLCWVLTASESRAQLPVDTTILPVPPSSNWSITANNTLLFNQAYFSNWLSGGANNAGWLAGLNYVLVRKATHSLWENNVMVNFGFSHTEGLGRRKTQDVINLSSNYGYTIGKCWYLSGGASFISQFQPGYVDGNNPDTTRISNFMAPGYLNTGLGFTYRPSSNFTLTLRPANARFTFVLDPQLQKANSFGLKADGDQMLFQFGALASCTYRLPIMENITLLNTGLLFSNYLDQPGNLVLGYTGLLNLKVNRFISTNLSLDLFYDHNQIAKVQIKQALGIGLAFLFEHGPKVENSDRPKEWKNDWPKR